MTFSQKSNFKHQKWLKLQFLTFWIKPKLISHKIEETEKLLDFHSVRIKSTIFALVQIKLIWQNFVEIDLHCDTVWKFHNFSITQIFREIIFMPFQHIKRLWILFVCEVLHFLMAEMYQNHTFRALQIEKWHFFYLWHSLKLISRKIWMERKFFQFWHSWIFLFMQIDFT